MFIKIIFYNMHIISLIFFNFNQLYENKIESKFKKDTGIRYLGIIFIV